MEHNEKNELNSEFLFNAVKTGSRMHANSIDRALIIANRTANLPQRSIYKIRKTVLSRLNQSGLFTMEQIRKYAGHSRESVVLYTHYFYTISGVEGIRKSRTFEEVVDYKMPVFDQFPASESDQSSTSEPKSDFSPRTNVIPFPRFA